VHRAESRERSYVKNNDKVEETARPVPLPFAAVGAATLTILGRSLVDELHFTDHAALPVILTVSK